MRAWVAACVALLGLALGGCDGSTAAPEPKDTFTPTETELDSPSAAESSDAGPVEPTLPAAAKAGTKAGAIAFVEYFWDLVNYAQATGDTAALRSATTPGCDTCASAIDSVNDVYARGGRITGGSYHVLGQQGVPTPSGSWAITARIHVGRQVIRGAGDLNQVYSAGTRTHVMDVAMNGANWEVVSWRVR